MRAGTEFPPVRTWFDGDNYWLSDGFQRVAATELTGVTIIAAEVLSGSLEDAKWDSYAANSQHGLRRTRADIQAIIERALEHLKGSQLSNNQIARHLNVPEATLRRWRRSASSSNGEDTSRIAVRAGRTYSIETGRIGRKASHRSARPKSGDCLRRELRDMKELASPGARTVLAMVDIWVCGRTSLTVCLEGIEQAVRDLSPPAGAGRRAFPALGQNGTQRRQRAE